jgi:hypothetical protein
VTIATLPTIDTVGSRMDGVASDIISDLLGR